MCNVFRYRRQKGSNFPADLVNVLEIRNLSRDLVKHFGKYEIHPGSSIDIFCESVTGQLTTKGCKNTWLGADGAKSQKISVIFLEYL